MFEYLKFSIGSMLSGYKSIVIRCENGMVEYEILRAGLLDIPKGKFHAHPADHWLEAWEALDASSWDAFYTSPDAPSGEAWRLIVRENGVAYKSEGDTAFPKQGQRFFEWLDCLMPEMEFISPQRLEQVIFRYQNAHNDRIDHERLEINRSEQKVLLEKWWELKSEEARPCYSVRSSHCYDFSSAREYMNELLELCQKELAPVEFEESGMFASGTDTSNPVTRIFLKLHDGSTLNGYIGSVRDPRWPKFLEGIHQYIRDLGSALVGKAEQPFLRERAQRVDKKYIYCKVRFNGSYRQYSYRTEDETLKVGDWVDVPVGQENKVICGRIEKIDRFDAEHVPYPINKTKIIFGKHEGDVEYEEDY